MEVSRSVKARGKVMLLILTIIRVKWYRITRKKNANMSVLFYIFH